MLRQAVNLAPVEAHQQQAPLESSLQHSDNWDDSSSEAPLPQQVSHFPENARQLDVAISALPSLHCSCTFPKPHARAHHSNSGCV